MLAKPAVLAALMVLAAPAFAASPFSGGWSGTWTDVGSHQSGTATLTIGDDGTSRGTVTNSLGLSSPLDGTVQGDGQTALTYTYNQFGTRITYHASGRLQVAGSRMSGVLDFALPNGVVFAHGAFTMHRRGASPAADGPLSDAGAAAAALLDAR